MLPSYSTSVAKNLFHSNTLPSGSGGGGSPIIIGSSSSSSSSSSGIDYGGPQLHHQMHGSQHHHQHHSLEHRHTESFDAESNLLLATAAEKVSYQRFACLYDVIICSVVGTAWVSSQA
jgi:hypothetical protein